jgi:hypothetical protein
VGNKKHHNGKYLRRERPSFENDLGTVPGVYEATTIAHRTRQTIVVTMVVGTFGVFKTSF